jgi:CheY-like chemotaxis protein
MTAKFESERDAHAAPVAGARACVLLAEDDSAMRLLLASQLLRHGYEVLIADDGLQLASQLEMLLHFPPAAPLVAIVSDMRMPGTDGLRVLRWLRSRGSRMAFILITAYGSDRLHEEALQLGAVAVLDKPFEMEELTAALRGLRMTPTEQSVDSGTASLPTSTKGEF